MTKFGKFCFYTPLKVAGISILISYIIASILIFISHKNRVNYNHSCDMSGIIYGIIIFPNFIASLLSYSIAINFYKRIRNNFTLSFLSFYSPTIVIILFIVAFDPGSLFSLILYSLPFIIPQTYYFIRFRKRLKSGEILEDFYE